MFCDLYMCRNNLDVLFLNFCKWINKLILTLLVHWNVWKYSDLILALPQSPGTTAHRGWQQTPPWNLHPWQGSVRHREQKAEKPGVQNPRVRLYHRPREGRGEQHRRHEVQTPGGRWAAHVGGSSGEGSMQGYFWGRVEISTIFITINKTKIIRNFFLFQIETKICVL